MKHKILLASILVVLVAAEVTLVGSGNIGKLSPKWSVSEECTPVAPGDTTGSVGSASLDAFARRTSVFAIDNDFTLTDPTSGNFRGNVVASPVSGRKVHLDVAGKLNFLVADRTVDPVWFTAATPLALAPLYRGGAPIIGSTLTTASIDGVAVDPFDGAIFVVSSGSTETGTLLTVDHYEVTKYSSTGTFITSFGGVLGAAGSANGSFGGASRVAVSPVDGSVAVGDGTNFRVQIFTPNGARTTYTYSTKVGTNGAGNGQFGSVQPIPVVYDSTGALYAADRGNARIQKFTISGTTVTYVAQVSVAGFEVNTPIYDLAISPTNVLYASLITNLLPGAPGTIRSYNTSLVAQETITPPVPAGTHAGIFEIAADSTGMWMYWAKSNYVTHYNYADGLVVEGTKWFSGRTLPTDLNNNYAIDVSSTGTVVVGFKNFRTGATSDLYQTPTQVGTFNWAPVPLSDAIENYMRECDSTLGGMTYSYDASSDPDVIFPAWSGDVWTKLKDLCTAFQVEIYPDNNTIRVEDVGARTVTLRNYTPLKIVPTNLFGGQQLLVTCQNPTAGGGIFFDASTQNTRFQIDMNQTAVVVVSTQNFPAALDTLIPSDTLPVLPGQYYVLDSTGAHPPAQTWLNAGASVAPALGDNPGQIKFTITGPQAAMAGYTGPFTFADSITATGKAALSLTGVGVLTSPRTYTFETGANPTKTTQLVARTINSFAIDDVERIAMVTPAAIEDVSGVAVTVTFDMPTADLLGFGLTTGSLFYAEDSRYRITNVTFGGLKASITAVRHVTLNDIDTAYTGLTYDQQDAIWAASAAIPSGFSYHDRTIKPLALSL